MISFSPGIVGLQETLARAIDLQAARDEIGFD
jgi:hypothetical protein